MLADLRVDRELGVRKLVRRVEANLMAEPAPSDVFEAGSPEVFLQLGARPAKAPLGQHALRLGRRGENLMRHLSHGPRRHQLLPEPERPPSAMPNQRQARLRPGMSERYGQRSSWLQHAVHLGNGTFQGRKVEHRAQGDHRVERLRLELERLGVHDCQIRMQVRAARSFDHARRYVDPEHASGCTRACRCPPRRYTRTAADV